MNINIMHNTFVNSGYIQFNGATTSATSVKFADNIFLASASVNRKNIIDKSGLKYEISASTFEENLPHSDFESSHAYVIETSRMKLVHKLQEFKDNNEKADIFITADTIISFDDKIVIEKP